MRCSLVSSELASAAKLRPQKPNVAEVLPQARGRRLPAVGVSLALALCALTGPIAVPAMANGTAIYSGAALTSPALPPALASDEHLLLWSHNQRLRSQAIEALNVLREAPSHGLPPSRYALSELESLATKLAHPKSERLFNELLTASIETYAIDLLQGLQPSAFRNRHDPKHRVSDRLTVSAQLQAAVLKGLHRSIVRNRISKFIASIEPAHKDYDVLQDALGHYRTLAANGGWPEVPRSQDGAMLLPGDHSPRVRDLRARLAITDRSVDLAGADDPELYDDALVEAVIAFQSTHSLKPDGKVGKNTRAALNVSAAERVRQLELNLDRWRLMPKVMPANHIWVNVPQYEMKLQLDRQKVLDMRVVVGNRNWPTPMMHEELEHVVFSPYWYPPRSIAVREILPKLKDNPDYLNEKRFDVLENNTPIDATAIDWDSITASNLPYRFRQRPGKGNSLGDVKFMFPNNYAVYMHDTNAKGLFNKSMRAFSHGCVRLEDPASLATALLEWDRGWKRQKVSSAMASGQQKYVKLDKTVPVYLVYFTATVEEGRLSFHDDIYGHDTRHSEQRNAQQDNVADTQVGQILARYSDSDLGLDAPTLTQVSARVTAPESTEESAIKTASLGSGHGR